MTCVEAAFTPFNRAERHVNSIYPLITASLALPKQRCVGACGCGTSSCDALGVMALGVMWKQWQDTTCKRNDVTQA